jgi:hypothetical protein
MCGACGILTGGPHWSDPVEGQAEAGGATRLVERQRRIALVNRLLAPSGMRLSEHGGQLVVRSPTGRTRLVNDLAHVWPAAESLGRARIDPLGNDFLASLAEDDARRPGA